MITLSHPFLDWKVNEGELEKVDSNCGPIDPGFEYEATIKLQKEAIIQHYLDLARRPYQLIQCMSIDTWSEQGPTLTAPPALGEGIASSPLGRTSASWKMQQRTAFGIHS